MAKGTDTRANGSKASGSKAKAPKETDPMASGAEGSNSTAVAPTSRGSKKTAKAKAAKAVKATKAKAAKAAATATTSTTSSTTKPKAAGSKSKGANAKGANAKGANAKGSAAKASNARTSSDTGSKGKASNVADPKRAVRLQHQIAAFERKESKLAKQLDKLHDRQSAARVRLSTLAPGSTAPDGNASLATPSTDGAGTERTAFCLREKRRVLVTDAHPTVLRNGRAAIAGVCASCGAKLVTLVAAPV